MIIAGIGCRPDAAAEAVVRLVRRSMGVAGQNLDAIAVPYFRYPNAMLALASKQLGVEIICISANALAARQAECPTRSELALRKTGYASVAEGCALAGAGTNSVLVLHRQDGDGVTCALAKCATDEGKKS